MVAKSENCVVVVTSPQNSKMAGGRGSPIPELMMLKNSQDQTQDANTALWELEKGLISFT